MSGLRRTIAFYVSAVVVGVLLGWFLHGTPAAPSVRVARDSVHAAVHRRDSVAVIVQHDTTRLASLLPQLQVAVTTLDVHDSASVVHLASLARAVLPAARAVVTSCAQLDTADRGIASAKDREIAARAALLPSRLTLTAAALYDPIARAPVARAETSVRITKHLAAIADAERGIGLTDSLRVHVGARWTF